ncbi:MAG: acyl-CoA dehydrogenase family protein [Candidatus Dormibacteraeota bacterium]|nr:acyl-CoA dehydrogenase family protein [Candidatus Dormibacteraeota bacterium]
MDLTLTAEQAALRSEVREWAAGNRELRLRAGMLNGREWQRRLAEGGWGAPAWPVEHGGRAAGPFESHLIAQELARAGAPGSIAVIGTGWAGPAIIAHGSEAQKQRFLPRILTGEEVWCQLFSEPNAGSDLAALSTRAVKEGVAWKIHGQKIWTSYARESDLGILLARTDPSSQRQQGITCFAFPMHQPEGTLEIRAIRQMDGRATFNEVFFDGAEVPDDHIIGQVGGGWAVAITTLMNERTNLSTGLGTLWGDGPTFADLLELARRSDLTATQRQRVADLHITSEAIKLTAYRMLSTNGSAASVTKLAADRWGQQVNELAIELLGMNGALTDDDGFQRAFLFAQALTIGGGTTEVQKNILAQRVLGLPRPV